MFPTHGLSVRWGAMGRHAILTQVWLYNTSRGCEFYTEFDELPYSSLFGM